MPDQTDDIGIDLETARGLSDAVRERLQATLDGATGDDDALQLKDRLERLSAGVAAIEERVAGQATASSG